MKEAIRFTIIVLIILLVIIGIIIWPLPGFTILIVILVSIGLYDVFQKNMLYLEISL